MWSMLSVLLSSLSISSIIPGVPRRDFKRDTSFKKSSLWIWLDGSVLSFTHFSAKTSFDSFITRYTLLLPPSPINFNLMYFFPFIYIYIYNTAKHSTMIVSSKFLGTAMEGLSSGKEDIDFLFFS